ncbi:SET domain-containing protein [Patescibacteria group bacterium]|nr:SET domain-containing protein [Patescibacteria group bacterium]
MKTNEFAKNWYIKNTGKHGRGVFAKRATEKGEIVDILTGRVVDLTEIAYWPDKGHYYWWQIGRTAWLMAGPPGEFINHSCDSNAAVVDLVKIVTIRDIEKDEEITVDYDVFDWDENTMPVKCLCGKENCRKIIKGYKFLPEETKAKYKQMGIVPEYILELEKDVGSRL